MGHALAIAVASGLLTAATAPELPSLHTPDEIAPAITPYVACLMAARGLPLLDGTTGSSTAPIDGPAGDCTAVRQEAAREALQLLRSKSGEQKDTAPAIVAKALDEVDAFAAATSQRREASLAGDSAEVVGPTVKLEDEVRPTYELYFGCLSKSVRRTGITSTNARSRFAEARAMCRKTRSAALIGAAKALSTKGWTQEERKKAAAATFNQTDESWTFMGRQLEQMLAKQESRAAGKAN